MSPYNATLMRCSDTLLAFTIFFLFGMALAIWPKALRDAQLSLRSKIPLANHMPGEQWMRTQRCVTLIRWQGIFLASFGLFLLLWHLWHCDYV